MRKKLSLLTALAIMPLLAFSQATPQHEQYVFIPSETTWASAYRNWSPGTPLYQGINDTLVENENFFISRVKPRERFTFAGTQVRPTQNASRKLLWWCPIGGDGWNAIPSYFFGGEVWGMWSYTDTWGNWTAPFITIPAAMLDVCHKNGVRVSVCAPVAWATSISPTSSGWGSVIGTMVGGGHTKLLEYLQYYGVDGIGFNSEFSWIGTINEGEYSGQAFHTAMKHFLGDCYTEAPNYGVPFHNAWYSLTSNTGSMGGSSALSSGNCDWFHYDSKITSDTYMTNYGAPLSTSQSTVESYFSSRSSFDVHMGIDYQAGTAQSNWTILNNYNISIGIWGAHNRNMIYEARGERGSDPQQQQKTYQMILENVFTGSTKNPVNPPAITSTTRFSSQSQDAYGWAQFITARSTLTCDDLANDPFVTYFNLGNGSFFNVNGVRQIDTEWYNLGLQDYLPTWRWWATTSYMGRDASSVSPDLTAEFTWNDAWFGGSCLQISGGTQQTYMQLFKTKYNIQKGDKLLIRYKVLSGNGRIAWACSTEDMPTTPVEATIIANALPGEWVEKTVTLGSGRSDLDIYDATLALIGLKFTNTSSDFKVLLGEISLYRGISQTPAAPIIEKSKIMSCNYKGVDMKVIFKMDSSKSAPVYNSDVNAWYYKIYTQQEGENEVMFTATTSWASYVVNAPYDYSEGTSDRMRIGVRAVSKDGKSESEISWGEWQTMPEPTVVEGLNIDKPIIKSAEEFTLSYIDPNHAPANWEIIKSTTGETVYSKDNVSSLTTKLNEEGSYDVKITTGSTVSYTRGLIQVSPASTGALPILDELTASKTTDILEGEEITLSYTAGRLGEGSVSRAIKVEDPQMLRFPEIVSKRPYTYMMWFKAERFLHSNQGTNLIDKRSFSDRWPHNNWGDLWVTVRPECTANKETSSSSTTGKYAIHAANEISFNTYGWTEHDNPNHDMMSTGYSVNPGQWTHVAVTCDANNNQKLYFNGKLVASAKVLHDNNEGVRYAGSSIYIGGTSTYKAGFTGWVDEFQIWDRVLNDDEVVEAMKGYEEAPSGLMGYWTFEEMVANDEGKNVFPNLGRKGSQYYAEYITTQGQKGEDTQEVQQTVISASNGELGNPAIHGTLSITTTADWDLDKGKLVETGGTLENGTAKVSYDAEGQYTPKLTLTNMWGSDQKTIDYIEVKPAPSGIEDIAAVEALGVYPNPFTDYVNLLFAKAGTYTVQIVAVDGRLIENKKLSVGDSEGVRIDINGSKGTYIIRVIDADNVAVRTVTVVKK